jgi:hypothetical protein
VPPKPVKAIYLTVTCAKVSGVALSEPRLNHRGTFRGYECESFGRVRTRQEREVWLEEALFAARCESLPLVVVLSEPSKLWSAALGRVKDRRDKAHLVHAAPNWRAKVLGKRRPAPYTQKVLEMAPHLSDDIAEALCLRVWAEGAPEVHELLAAKIQKPKKRKAA